MYDLTSIYATRPGHRQDVGMVKVTIEGITEHEVQMKPGMVLIEAAINAILETGNFPPGGLYWDGVPGNEPCEFISFDPETDHLVVRFK
jgi:hypothetical protein